ncbi:MULTISPECIES: phosphoserine phosphatase SerB [unclassified Arthrobacter]|uniref:phosphoserine phosphatase SerB n=1 Tax=unclassified Arthrobacter TaxID=235627 RepID=UPI0014928BC7|nr:MULTISPECIES: phosphoserine phosphatase SerB [unclassified Arthrobacter]MBE0010717.1 phosphoserine phosphatase SerB [Arthrobacter sp. AET 35A]NOJ64660.1 phosphoserine phosphatase SerB [Arthrobacter sp. 147(2020)]
MPREFGVVSYGVELTDDFLIAVQGSVQGTGAQIVELENGGDSRFQASTLIVSFDGDAADLRKVVEPHVTRELGVAVVPPELLAEGRKLLIMDVDSTLIRQEVIELLAAHAGREAEVAAVTEAAMRGEIDFTESLRSRVAVLKGLPVSVLTEVGARIELSDGAAELVRHYLLAGHAVAAVSGGFTQLLDPLAAQLGLTFAEANLLGISADGHLTGEVVGPVVDRVAKERALRRWAAEAGVPLERTIAVGDGANDLDMLTAAALGVAFNAKPAVRAAADASIDLPYLDLVRHFSRH